MEYLIEYDLKIKKWLHEIKEKIDQETFVIETIETKSDHRDLVSTVDKLVENYLRDKITLCFPEDIIVGEESSLSLSDIDISKNIWIIDPIDATANFLKQGTDYCILIAYFENTVPKLSYIFDVEKDELIYAIENKGVFNNEKKIENVEPQNIKESLVSLDVRKLIGSRLFNQIINEAFDVRYIGCAGLDGSKVITGKFGAYLCPQLHPWDYAPFILIAKELNLHFSDFEGNDIEFCSVSDVILSSKTFYNSIKLIN